MLQIQNVSTNYNNIITKNYCSISPLLDNTRGGQQKCSVVVSFRCDGLSEREANVLCLVPLLGTRRVMLGAGPGALTRGRGVFILTAG